MLGILYILIGIVTLLALTKRGRFLIKGFINLFFEDAFSTPEGANAAYSEAINEAEKSYKKASDSLQRIVGMLDTSKRNFESTKKDIINTKAQCEALAQKQDFDRVNILAQKLQGLEEDLIMYQKEIEEYTPMFNDAKTIANAKEQELKQLMKDRKVVVKKLEINKKTKAMYDDLDELKHTKPSDKALATVKEKVLETGEMAIGARTVHQNKLSTKLLEAENSAKAVQYNDYVEQLKKKYQKQ